MSDSLTTHDLKQLYLYIQAEVRGYLFQIRANVPPELLKDEIDELTQVAWFKFWEISQRKQITYRRAYISKIVHSLVIDTARRYRSTARLSFDEYGEVTQGRIISPLSEEMLDPALEFEQKETRYYQFEEIVKDIVSLPPCQRRAIICQVKDRVEDIQFLADEFKKYGIAIDRIHWQNGKRAAQASRASLSIARKKMRSLHKRDIFVE